MVIANHVEIGGRILPEVDRISDVGQRRTALVVAADLDESTARRSVFRPLLGGAFDTGDDAPQVLGNVPRVRERTRPGDGNSGVIDEIVGRSGVGIQTGGPGGNSGSREPSARSGAPQAHARRSEFLPGSRNLNVEGEVDFSHQTLHLNRSRSDDGRSLVRTDHRQNAIGRYGGLAGESERRSLERLERNVRIGHPVPGRELLETTRTDVGDEIDLRVAGSLVQSDAERITVRGVTPDHARIVILAEQQLRSIRRAVELQNPQVLQSILVNGAPALGSPQSRCPHIRSAQTESHPGRSPGSISALLSGYGNRIRTSLA